MPVSASPDLARAFFPPGDAYPPLPPHPSTLHVSPPLQTRQGANILVDKKGTIKLADFGASKKIEDLATMGSAGSGANSIRGTPYWMVCGPTVCQCRGKGE